MKNKRIKKFVHRCPVCRRMMQRDYTVTSSVKYVCPKSRGGCGFISKQNRLK